MTRRLLPIALLVLALLVPLGAQAKTLNFGTVNGPDPATSPRATLHKARTALLDGQGVRKGADITPLLKELAVKLPSLTGTEHKRAVDLLQRPSQGEGGFNELESEVAEQPPLCSAHFCVHWVKSTDDAPHLPTRITTERPTTSRRWAASSSTCTTSRTSSWAGS